MISKEEQTRATVAEQAVDWFLERDEGPLDTRESVALMAWYQASPLNVEEFLGVAAIARDLRDAGPDPEHSVETLVARTRADADGGVQPLRPRAWAEAVDVKRTTAWLHRQIAFNHEPLERVVDELNRYAPKPIEIMTPELRKLEITGAFSIDDSEEFLDFLRTLDGVRVDVTATEIRVSKK